MPIYTDQNNQSVQYCVPGTQCSQQTLWYRTRVFVGDTNWVGEQRLKMFSSSSLGNKWAVLALPTRLGTNLLGFFLCGCRSFGMSSSSLSSSSLPFQLRATSSKYSCAAFVLLRFLDVKGQNNAGTSGIRSHTLCFDWQKREKIEQIVEFWYQSRDIAGQSRTLSCYSYHHLCLRKDCYVYFCAARAAADNEAKWRGCRRCRVPCVVSWVGTLAPRFGRPR